MASEPIQLEVRIPDIGDFDDVDIVDLLVSPADPVEPEDTLVTLVSDKAAMRIPSQASHPSGSAPTRWMRITSTCPRRETR